jgi:hypothetical protein
MIGVDQGNFTVGTLRYRYVPRTTAADGPACRGSSVVMTKPQASAPHSRSSVIEGIHVVTGHQTRDDATRRDSAQNLLWTQRQASSKRGYAALR